MKLINVDSNFSVESLKFGNKTVEFVHNAKTMENYFPQKTLASMFGVSQPSISQSLKTVKQNINDNIRDSYIIKLGVKSKRNNSNMLFYSFKVVTMLASRINTPEAFNMLEWIDSSLNTMFNVATGKTDFNNMEVLV